MHNKRVILEGLTVHKHGHQGFLVTDDAPLNVKTLVAGESSEQMVGRMPDSILCPAWEVSCAESTASDLNDVTDISIYEQRATSNPDNQLILYGSEETKDDKTTPAEESNRLEFHDISVAKNGRQAIVVNDENPITAKDIHCKENAGQVGGRMQGETFLRMWRASHVTTQRNIKTAGTASKPEVEATAGGASRRFDEIFNSM
jgi:hypothetical protein